jgi:hypothetical protein
MFPQDEQAPPLPGIELLVRAEIGRFDRKVGSCMATAGLLTPISRAFQKSADYAGMAEQLASGKLRALATASPTRIEALVDVPTVAEFGYKDYGVDLWFGLVAPARTS